MNKRIPICCAHNHETGEFQGWLCARHNLAMGQLRDNAVEIERLAYWVAGKSTPIQVL